jgi:hypothetical protein
MELADALRFGFYFDTRALPAPPSPYISTWKLVPEDDSDTVEAVVTGGSGAGSGSSGFGSGSGSSSGTGAGSGVSPLARLIAHELGHGLFTLEHTFVEKYGGGGSLGSTSNLMDYADGLDLAAFQWNIIANPAPLTWFDADGDGMAYEGKNEQKVRDILYSIISKFSANEKGILDVIPMKVFASDIKINGRTYGQITVGAKTPNGKKANDSYSVDLNKIDLNHAPAGFGGSSSCGFLLDGNFEVLASDLSQKANLKKYLFESRDDKTVKEVLQTMGANKGKKITVPDDLFAIGFNIVIDGHTYPEIMIETKSTEDGKPHSVDLAVMKAKESVRKNTFSGEDMHCICIDGKVNIYVRYNAHTEKLCHYLFRLSRFEQYEGNFNFAGREEILKYLLTVKRSYIKDMLGSNTSPIDIKSATDADKNQAWSIIGSALGRTSDDVIIQDNTEALSLLNSFITLNSCIELSEKNEDIVNRIKSSETFPENQIHNILSKISNWATFVTSFMDEYKNVFGGEITAIVGTAGNAASLTYLAHSMRTGNNISLSDALSMIPHPIAKAIAVLIIGTNRPIDDYITNINETLFNETPQWEMIINWDVWKGKSGIPDQPLYLYYTDDPFRVNPTKMPTSIVIKNHELAREIFGFMPKYVDFDIQGKIQTLGDSKILFVPLKQVEYPH